ncbi:hypothetical protein SAMN05444678_102396 [Sphingomonas sp. YR710]|uniref:hypothetical protein n=1 Tax=Sphingomonas sp. YR710 TaxID=1882773 RepID=UPI000882E73F|nr:hypothetical protein [Sphingomonas sp. YR710]SDC35407.1 hypothetical protein SAMN05444678_102396 [Sphingomonas sp. YR710]
MTSKTVIFYTMQTSGTASTWRILTKLDRRCRTRRTIGDERFTQGASFAFDWSEIPPEDYLVFANCPHDLKPIDNLNDQRFIVNFRDPRDRICNEFMWYMIHPLNSEDTPEQIEARAAILRDQGIDAWISERLKDTPLTDRDYYQYFMRNVDRIPAQDRVVNSYARLCLGFDSFVERSCIALGLEPTSERKAAVELERAEKLELNPRWIGHTWAGSDTMPGRYKREMRAETIAFVTDYYAPVLRAMARLDPDYADLYLEGLPLASPVRSAPDAVVNPASAGRDLSKPRPLAAEGVTMGSKSEAIARSTIVDRADLRIDHFRSQAKNETVVFTFSERTNRDLAGPGFATEFLLKNGVDVVAIKTNRDVWYENLLERDIREIDRSLSWTATPYRQRLAYGSSMGAYAAIRFSRALRFDRVVALSPLFDIKQGWETRWREDLPALSPDLLMLALPGEAGFEQTRHHISDSCDFLMVFDPLDPDLDHIRRFQQVIAPERLQLLAVPYGGHPAGQYLLEIKMLGDVGLSALKEGRFPSIAAARRQYKGHSTIHLFQLAEHCQRRGHLHWALAINKRLIALLDHPEHQLQACRILRELGSFDEAVAAVDRALGFADYIFRPNIENYRQDMIAQRAAA